MTLNREQFAALARMDDRGHGALHKISPFVWVETATVAGVRVRMVPIEFWTQDVDDEDKDVALVACPCGHTPAVPALEMFSCECQRVYFNGITEVWSLNVPSGSPPDESPPEEP